MAGSYRIGPFTVLRPLGAGGMAETFVAERRGPGEFVQQVCLKRIRSDLANEPELVRQFMAEAAIAARLRHASIAQVLDFGEDDGQLYLAIELIDGLDLRELLKHQPDGLPATLVQHIAIELCTALDVAHSSPSGAVIHRDVSPSNVLISTEGEVKLADFGIARSMTAPSHTRTGIVRGKVPYMAPEYARTGRYDVRADLFSLGVLLYECACGERPHDGMTDLETLERATRGEHTPLSGRAPTLPPGLAGIIEQLLEPEPELRFDTASALLEALLSLPSDSRARRELGACVSAGQRSERASRPAKPAAPSPSRSNQDARTRTATAEELRVPTSGLGPKLALGSALIAAAIAITIALRRPSDDAVSPPSQNAPLAGQADAPAPVAEQLVVRPVEAQAPIAAAPDAAVHAADPPATEATASSEPARARLRVIVMPHGDVFVDDVRAGRAPITLNLKPGAHTIRAEGPGGVMTRRVVLRAGERERLVFQ